MFSIILDNGLEVRSKSEIHVHDPRPVSSAASEFCEDMAKSKMREAVACIAAAAEWSTRSREFTSAPLGGAETNWFLVRSLCHEHGLSFESVRQHAWTYVDVPDHLKG